MKEKLSRIRSPWRRLLLSLVLSAMVFIDQAKSPRSKVHWIGVHDRPRRLERALFIALLFISMFVFEPRQYILWASIWGGGVSLYIILHSFLIVVRVKVKR